MFTSIQKRSNYIFFCKFVSDQYVPTKILKELSDAVLIALCVLVLVNTLTISGILFSMVLIKRFFKAIGESVDVKTMIFHCVFFTLSYVSVTWYIVKIY